MHKHDNYYKIFYREIDFNWVSIEILRERERDDDVADDVFEWQPRKEAKLNENTSYFLIFWVIITCIPIYIKKKNTFL
jgi:hypothetical protein